MIPRRISLRGFLCYREEQELDFSGATLWMLGGPNGSGKSAVFDAVTYALFGHHRAGSQHAAELINKEADGLQVEFDFTLDDDLCRARRTLRKTNRGGTTATQGIYRHATAHGADKWEAVPDTNRKTEFDAWVRDRLGLTYETFTSSVLLLQGRAEKLLDSTAKGRFEVLAGIVDMERYARLHAKVDDRRRALKAKAEALGHQMDALPPVSDEELSAAEAKIATAETNRADALAEVERWRDAEIQSQRWAELQGKSAALAMRLRQAESLVAEADSIERDAERCRELMAVLPHLETAVKQQGQIAESERASENLETTRGAAQERLAACESALSQAQKKREALQKTIGADEPRQRELEARLRRLEGICAKLTLLEQQRLELGRREAELAQLPADAEAQLSLAQAAHDEIAHLTVVAPLLARFVQSRDDLRLARERERRMVDQERSIKADGEKLAAELKALTPQVESQTAERQRADDAASAAKALRKQAADEAAAFRELEGAKLCRQCGQELTPAHFADELAKRQAEVKEADEKLRAASAAQKTAQQAEADLKKRNEALEKERQAKREEYRDLHRQLEHARNEADRHVRECTAVYRDLPEPFRIRIATAPPADWLGTSEPMQADVDAARAKLAGLDAARARLQDVRQQHLAWTKLNGQVQTLRQGVDALVAEMPGEPDELRRTFARTEAEEKAVAGALKASRAESRIVQEELDRLTTARQTLVAEVSAVAGRLQSEETSRKHCRQSVDAAIALLPDPWKTRAERARLTELHAWKTERDDLTERGVEQKSRDLQQARLGFEALRQSKGDLDREMDGFPADARRPLSEVQTSLHSARQRSAAFEETVGQARHEKALLDDRQKRRSELHSTILAVDRDHNRFDLLAELLSRERLQLHLVRQAERQIVDQANAVLDRLSGGQLYLQLRPGEPGQETDKALELEAFNRTTGGTAINASFLSGSQRFRVAVSLALGIGQYASRRHRPIESVIIDEGFGCLDRNGRQVMIQELQNLRGHLSCILLVSHQEEFTEAFADGYRFELTDGTTRVRRVQH